MEGEYDKIREQALTEAENAAEPEKAEEPAKAEEPENAAEPEKATEPEKSKKAKATNKAEDPAKPEKTEQPRMISEGCGRSYSMHTKRHVCKAPKGFEKEENVPQEPVPPAAPVDPVQRQITLPDVTQFLIAETKLRRQQRRDDLLGKMF